MKNSILTVLVAALSVALLVPGNAEDSSTNGSDAKLLNLSTLVKGKSSEDVTQITTELVKETAKIPGTKEEVRKRLRDLAAVLFSTLVKEDASLRDAVTSALIKAAPDENDDIVVATIATIANTYLDTETAAAVIKTAVEAAGNKEAVAGAAASPESTLGVPGTKRVKQLAKDVMAMGKPDEEEKKPKDFISKYTVSTTSTTTTTTTTSTTRPSPTPVGLR